MNDWCMMRVKWIGKNSKKVMRKFYRMSKQDYWKSKRKVGLVEGNKDIELEFVCLISYFDTDIIGYITEVPNIDTLITIADYYELSFEVYHSEVNGYCVGYGEYDYDTRDFAILDLFEEDFMGCVFKDCQYHFEGVIYPNKYSLHRYIWLRKYRKLKIDKILNDVD